ncbi:hypothetical protein JKP88DRAFT_267994 [Tribonema minus]|uniref:SWIM-type domain-containing protein n=1 Tax=Tribonema minus TaxID=303371 RepID=A0A836CHP0_9STRA|nr:hypothetical protein JKP88DRAFT_267994 [Tribonema minus]
MEVKNAAGAVIATAWFNEVCGGAPAVYFSSMHQSPPWQLSRVSSAEIAAAEMQVQFEGEHTTDGVVPVPVNPDKLDLSCLVIRELYNSDRSGQASRSRMLAQLGLQYRAPPRERRDCALLQVRARRPLAAHHHHRGGARRAARPQNQFFVSDTKWTTCPQKCAFTVIGAMVPEGMQPLALSISNEENEDTTFILAKTLENAAPCGEDCRHEWHEEWVDDKAAYYRKRRCRMVTPPLAFPVMVGIDKSSMSRKAFLRARWLVSCCFFHNIRATMKNIEKKLQSKKRKADEGGDPGAEEHVAYKKAEPHPMLRAFDLCLRILLHSQSADEYNRKLEIFLDMIEQWWKNGWLGKTTPLADWISYIKQYFGGRWGDAMGDHIGHGVPGYAATNNAVESGFLIVDKCLLFGKMCSRFTYLIELVLGVTADGTPTMGPSYFPMFKRLLSERKRHGRKVVRRPVEKQRDCNARWLLLEEFVKRPEHPLDPAGPEGPSEWYLVRAREGAIAEPKKPPAPAAPKGKAPKAKASKAKAKAKAPAAKAPKGQFDPTTAFDELFRASEPADIPVADGFYAVGMRDGPGGARIVTCICRDYYHRGNSHDNCKHAIAAILYKEVEDAAAQAKRERLLLQQQESDDESDDAADQAERDRLLLPHKMHIMKYLGKVEQRKPDKDQVLYDACKALDWARVHARLLRRLKGGCKGAQGGGVVVHPVRDVTIAAGVECDIEFRPILDYMCTELTLRPITRIIRNGMARDGKITLRTGDIVYSVTAVVGGAETTVHISCDDTAREAEQMLRDATVERVVSTQPYVACGDSNEPHLEKRAKDYCGQQNKRKSARK